MARIEPVGAADGIRARVPDVLRSYAETRATVLEDGLVDPGVKRLCERYLAEDPDVMSFEDPSRFDQRERAALAWAHAIAWDADAADDALWQRLHASFSEPELVELGYFIAFQLGQAHWVRTLGLRPEDG